MHASARSRAGRAGAGTILIVGVLAALPVLPLAPARCCSTEEANLGFLMPTAMRRGCSFGELTTGRGGSPSAACSARALASTGGALMGVRVDVHRNPAVLLRAEFEDFKRGDAVTGKVAASVNRKYLLIEVPGLSRNAIAFRSRLKKYIYEYEVGEEFVAKVHSVDSAKSSLKLTQRPLDLGSEPERMAAKFEIIDISNMLNEQMEGIVMNVPPFGIFLDIGVAGKNALAPRVYLPDGKLPKDFTPGQKVPCWVVAVDEAEMKMTVSLVAPPEGGFPQPS